MRQDNGNKLFLYGLPNGAIRLFALQRKRLADDDGHEDQRETHQQAQAQLFAVQQHAEQHAEHRFQAQEQRCLRRRNMRQRHVLDAERHDGSENAAGR
mgnify:CR=1 FL=1